MSSFPPASLSLQGATVTTTVTTTAQIGEPSSSPTPKLVTVTERSTVTVQIATSSLLSSNSASTLSSPGTSMSFSGTKAPSFSPTSVTASRYCFPFQDPDRRLRYCQCSSGTAYGTLPMMIGTSDVCGYTTLTAATSTSKTTSSSKTTAPPKPTADCDFWWRGFSVNSKPPISRTGPTTVGKG